MVCGKCQKKLKATELATPGVKNKNDMYYGSPSSTLGGGSAKGKSTLGSTGVGKVSCCLFHSDSEENAGNVFQILQSCSVVADSIN